MVADGERAAGLVHEVHLHDGALGCVEVFELFKGRKTEAVRDPEESRRCGFGEGRYGGHGAGPEEARSCEGKSSNEGEQSMVIFPFVLFFSFLFFFLLFVLSVYGVMS